MNKKAILILFVFVVLFSMLSMEVMAARGPFSGIGTSISKFFQGTFTIPHPGDYNWGNERVSYIAFFGTLVILFAIFYGLVISQSKLQFLSTNKNVGIAFSIALSLLVIYAVPIVEWITSLIVTSVVLMAIIAFVVIFIEFYLVLHRVSARGVKVLAASAKEMDKGLKELREAKLVDKDPKGTIDKAEADVAAADPNSIGTALGDYTNFVAERMANIPIFDTKNLLAPSLGSVNNVFREYPNGLKLVRETADKLRELKNKFLRDAKTVDEFKAINERVDAVNKKANEFQELIDKEQINQLVVIRKNLTDAETLLYNEMNALLAYACAEADKLKASAGPEAVKEIQKKVTAMIDKIKVDVINSEKPVKEAEDKKLKEIVEDVCKEKKKILQAILKDHLNNSETARSVPAVGTNQFKFEGKSVKGSTLSKTKPPLLIFDHNTMKFPSFTIRLKIATKTLEAIQKTFKDSKVKEPTSTAKAWNAALASVTKNYVPEMKP